MINTRKLMAACNKAPQDGLEFIEAVGRYDYAVMQCNRAGIEENAMLTRAARKAFGKLRQVEKASGMQLLPIISDDEMITVLDSIIFWSKRVVNE